MSKGTPTSNPLDARKYLVSYNRLDKRFGVTLKNINGSKSHELWLKSLGSHISELIKKKGYTSPYELWIERGEGMVSRATLNNVIQGKRDHKITSLRNIAKMLNVPLKDLLDF